MNTFTEPLSRDEKKQLLAKIRHLESQLANTRGILRMAMNCIKDSNQIIDKGEDQ